MTLIEKNRIEEVYKIVEAGFRDKDIDNAFLIIKRQIQRRLKAVLYVCPNHVSLLTKYGLKQGKIFFCILKGKYVEIRFNFARNDKIKSNNIESMDVYYGWEINPGNSIHIDTKDNNILQLLDVICEAILNPNTFIKQQNMLKESNIKEKKDDKLDVFVMWKTELKLDNTYLSEQRKIDLFTSFSNWSKDNGQISLSFPTFNKVLKEFMQSVGLTQKYDRIRVKKGEPFKLLPSVDDKELIEFIKQNEDLDDLSDSLDELKLDINVLQSSLKKESGKNLMIVYGKAGISKSSTTRKLLDETVGAGNYVYIRPSIKNQGDFYKLLYKNCTDKNGNNIRKIIVIDDADIVIKKNSILQNLLLAATDSSLRNRKLSYFNINDKDLQSSSNPDGKYPQSFTFTGAIIQITNAPLTAIAPNVVSRAVLTEISASDESLILEIKKHLNDFYTDIPLDIKEKAVDFIVSLRATNTLKAIDFRHYGMILDYLSSDAPFELVKTILVKKLLKMK